LNECQTTGRGLNGAFAPACVQLYQICILADYSESKPLTPIKDHLVALNSACQVVDSAQLYFEQASIICPLALRLDRIVIFPFSNGTPTSSGGALVWTQPEGQSLKLLGGARRGTAMAGTDSIPTPKQRNVASTGFAAILKMAPAHPNRETLKSQSRPQYRSEKRSYASTKTLGFIPLFLG